MQARKVWEMDVRGRNQVNVLWHIDENFRTVDEDGQELEVDHLLTTTGVFQGAIETVVYASDEDGQMVVYGDPIRVFRGVKDHVYAMREMGFEIAPGPATPTALPRTDTSTGPGAQGN